MKWWRRLNRMADIKLVKKVSIWKPIEVRTEGWPKNRWRDEVINDLKKPKLRICFQSSKIEKSEMIWCRRPKLMQGCSG